MSNPNQNPVQPFTVDLNDLDSRFSLFIDQWRAELARGGKEREFDFEKNVVLPVLPVPVKVEEQNLIKIDLAANGKKLGVFITPNSLYTVGFVCQSGKKYALFETSKDLLSDRVIAHPSLLTDESYDTMGGFIDKDLKDLNRASLANKLVHAIHGLADPEGKEITDLGKKMGVIAQVIIEPIRFRILQQQYTEIFSPNASRVALPIPIDVSNDNEVGSGHVTQASGSKPLEVFGTCSDNSHVDRWIEKKWGYLSRIALEAHKNGKYKQKGYELEGCKTYYRLKKGPPIKFETIQNLVKALGVAKEKSQELEEEEKGSSSTAKSSKINITSIIQMKLRGKRERK